ncbi:glycosyltransferase [Candidatus Daviesbacteria bacterium]|nr:glycosyltransferase [Candidatus Daviesbacteria bacterium]
MNAKKYRFCIVTYETFPNPITQNLKTFLLENYSCDLIYILHPQLDLKEGYQMSSGFSWFKNNKLIQSKTAYHWKTSWPLLYIKDILYTLFWCLRFGKIDVYFAAGNLNPLAAILLREVGFVKEVIYQSVDYYPTRFQNSFLNWFYFRMDKLCVEWSDETWNVSSMIAQARQKKMDMDPKIFNRQYTVPGCVWFHQVKRLPFAKVNRKKIVYRGVLLPFMGVDLVIRAMPHILKEIPSLIFEIVGTGVEEEKLKNLAKSLKVSKSVIFHGFVKGRENMEKVLSDAALGIATFNTDILDDKVKNSDPGKIKDYMLLGMPIITTKAFPGSKYIVKNRCGLIVSYRAEDLAKTILGLLQNKNLLKEYRENVVKYIEKFDCVTILERNIERVLNGKVNTTNDRSATSIKNFQNRFDDL